jgi:hypothetical protein
MDLILRRLQAVILALAPQGGSKRHAAKNGPQVQGCLRTYWS